jgi:hypothetical protein
LQFEAALAAFHGDQAQQRCKSKFGAGVLVSHGHIKGVPFDDKDTFGARPMLCSKTA